MLNSDAGLRLAASRNNQTYSINSEKGTNSLDATMADEEPVVSNRSRLLVKKSTAEMIGILNEKVFKLQDEKMVKSQYQRYRRLDIMFGIATFIPMIFTAISCDLQFNNGNPHVLSALLYTTFIVTLISVVLNIVRYKQELKYLKAINALDSASLFKSGMIYYLLLEIAILMIVPYPWTTDSVVASYDEDDDISFYYNLNDILSIFITMRIPLLLRMALHLTSYMSPTVVRLSYFYGTRNGYTYAVKCLMKRYPLMTVVVNYIASILIFAYMLRLCERPLDTVPGETYIINSYWNATWYVVATMTTVGYGDFYVRTNLGRLVSFFCCTWGAVIISLIVVVLTSVLEMSASEKKILIIMERLHEKRKLKTKAANLITSVAKLIFINAKKRRMGIEINEEEKAQWTHKMEHNLKGFRKHSMKIRTLDDRENTNEEMGRQFEFMRHEMKEIKQAIGALTSLVKDHKAKEQIAKPAQEPSTGIELGSKAGI